MGALGLDVFAAYLHASDDINSNVQIFADVLVDHDVASFNTGTVSLQTSGDSTGPYNYFVDSKVTPCVQPERDNRTTDQRRHPP